MTRVSVDREALNNLIGDAHSNLHSVMSEFCASTSEEQALERGFADLVTALDIRAIQ